MRGLKAPRDGEPNFPPRVDTVLSVASIQVLGHPLDERWVHRPERVAAVTGARAGETLTTAHLARLLASPEGALKGVGGAPVIPVINKVDDGRWAEQARKTARQALAMTARFDRVVLTALNRDEPLVECVYRDAYPRA
jgi:probable selenium-dependent hydroxylase accessory protein YqeC